MAIDYRGNPITPKQIEGLERFQRNDVPMKLCYTPSTTLTFEIDETYQNEHEDDAEVYSLLLPSQIHDLLFVPTVGEMINFSQQYAGEVLDKSIIKQFQVTGVEKVIEQSVATFCLFITISVVPVEEQKQKG